MGASPSSEPSEPAAQDAALDTLLEKLGSGDGAAAETVFRTYEPCLRAVVRRMLSPNLRTKFDSADVVQSVWVDLLKGFQEAGWRFASAGHLRAFLVKATRNRFIDRVRKHRKPLATQQSLEVTAQDEMIDTDVDRPSDVVQAEELWERMRQLCPPQHHRLLQLRREGMSLAEIAAQTGLHESSVRRILYDLARRLAADS